VIFQNQKDLIVVIQIEMGTQPEISVSGGAFDEMVTVEKSIHESDFSAIFLKRPKCNVILEIEDESLHSSVFHISRDKPNTLFDEENPSMAVVIR
jgi:hypothetical protein